MPVQGWLVRRGLTEWTGALAATLIGFVTAVAVFSPLVIALYVRLEQVVDLVASLPREPSVSVFGMTYTIEAGQVQSSVLDFLSGAATSFALELPVLAIKFALFVVLLFGLLLKGSEAGRAAIAPVPHDYRDIVYALARRARETLYAIYVLQLATSLATLAVAYPLFRALGYEAAMTLAIAAAVLQFVPIIGPSMLVVPITLYHVAVGDPRRGDADRRTRPWSHRLAPRRRRPPATRQTVGRLFRQPLLRRLHWRALHPRRDRRRRRSADRCRLRGSRRSARRRGQQRRHVHRTHRRQPRGAADRSRGDGDDLRGLEFTDR